MAEDPAETAGGGHDEVGDSALAKQGRSARPTYVDLFMSGELARREEALFRLLDPCRLCPRECQALRLQGQSGICSEQAGFKVASAGPHFGEERPLVGKHGSGTIFFSNCNLLCVYCQNWEIAHRGDGRQTEHEQLARMMIALQERGCHNINLVTPTHILPHIVKALGLAVAMGLSLPLVYNTGGYDKVEVLKLLAGVIDIYMPDFKYQAAEPAARFSRGAADYPEVTAAALKEMDRQVGSLQLVDGVAVRGLLVRHLVLPNGMAGSADFIEWVAKELGTSTAVNIMGQYRPMHRAFEFSSISRGLTRKEHTEVVKLARKAGLRLL